MDFRLNFGTPRGLLDKLKKDAVSLDNEMTSSDFFDFVVTGYSIIDWVKNSDDNSSAAQSARAAVDRMRSNRFVQVCGDIAIACKHYRLDRRIPIISGVESSQGYGIGRFGKGGFGEGEEEVEIHINGSVILWDDFVNGVINAWDDFFAAHGI